MQRPLLLATGLTLIMTLNACGGGGSIFRNSTTPEGQESTTERNVRESLESGPNTQRTSLLGDLFSNTDDPNTTLEVNKYIWNAALDVLDFLPIQRVDPFSGVIVTGFGTPPGGRTAYRATIFVQDPALEARSLNVALVTRSGPASVETVRAVEDAILSRARQLRIRDINL